MKHLSQQMISKELRRPHLKRWRRLLQRRMAYPGLSSDDRRVLERDFLNVGNPKVYDADDPPPVGSLHPGKRPPVQIRLEDLTHESLSTIPHTSLYLYAIQNNLEVVPGNTKAQVIKKILGHTQGEP